MYLKSSISGALSWASLSLGRKAADPATLGLAELGVDILMMVQVSVGLGLKIQNWGAET